MMMFDEYDEEESPLIARHGEVTPLPWSCAFCGEANETLLDLSGGYEQEYVEDCAVCCRPNVLYINVDPSTLATRVDNVVE